MAMELKQVVPFGRSLDEYIKMFNLTQSDLQKSILSVGDGPASFNAEGTKLGYKIKSVDPLYELTGAQIRSRFDEVVDNIIEQIKNSPDDWVWTYHASPDDLRKNRERVIDIFCEDYEIGKNQGRYEIGALPKLKYGDRKYDIGLCSHFLFLYSDQFDADFHFDSICEILRICKEVRVFPLLTLSLMPSPHLQPVLARLEAKGYRCTINNVSYQLQRGGNEMIGILNVDS
ncbi:MAG TPA: SAM-dependent methyltransferase [Cyanobacteria bacterium UBA11149]|nr:SAM-dependent methyltransferase [Cyanobacteria bacterium UBA11367]HBE57988.1 SAM-dependent methyltransferase [Cyanobacteria bacterium UBA11366]HBK64732.1 SAM-dependent methyltransferase [Cyanobacteria bacterium UBA11166]HBR74001.1 SAM-dependent methyltransferase [Cyanobacteria bacterium UBA11159]HBS72098.1 SAM-dependent methyltransferase [Cyanobacteria bacterium UBA11153]HBW91297.1 SAM-dependent methyltransferase [Cyanobacteria bacterium UBA11149]HCA96249.1 SAM-dependent methyltransferase 